MSCLLKIFPTVDLGTLLTKLTTRNLLNGATCTGQKDWLNFKQRNVWASSSVVNSTRSFMKHSDKLRLCLVAVKRFPEKENVSMCLVAFQKIFRKIFSGVWKRRRKTQIRKHKPQPRKKKNHQRRKCFQSDDRAVIAIRDRDRRRDRDPRSQSRRRSWSRTGAGAGDLGLDLLLVRARARSLSLSLSFSGNALKEK